MVVVDPDDTVGPDDFEPEALEPGGFESGALESGALESGALGSDAVEASQRRAQIRRLRNIMLIVLAALVVVGGVIAGPTGWHVFQQRNTKVSAPDEAAGLQRDNGDNAQATAGYIRDAVATAVNLSGSVGAVYWDGSNRDRSILFTGGGARLWSPADQLGSAFKVITDDTGGVRDVRTVPAGALGGVMQCGTTTTDDTDITVCGWADYGSLAVALFPSRGIDESAKLMLEMRTATEHRS